MKLTFTPFDMNETVLDALRRATGMQTLQTTSFECLANLFQLHNAYRRNPFWGNPETRRRYQAALARAKESGQLSDIHKITRAMDADQKRYHWDVKLSNQLSDPTFWDRALEGAQTLDDLGKLRTPWEDAAEYAYYRREDLQFLNEHVFSTIEAYIKHARAEIADLNGRTRERERGKIGAFQTYLTEKIERPLKKEQAKMAQAMLVRLQLAAQYNNLAFGDVLYHFSEQFKAANLQHEEEGRLGPRPYTAPRQGLTRNDFQRYHRFIQTYGNRAAKDALQRLPWVRDEHYVYDTTKNTWGTNKNIIAEAEVPPSRVTFLRWFFRGRNARHEALHDVTRYLEVQMHLKSAEAMQAELAEGNTDGLSDNELKGLLQSQHALQREQQRIQLLRRGLNAVFHKQSKRVLTSYLQKITNAIESLAEVQKTIVQKAQASLPDIINNEATLDHVMRLLDQLTNTISLLPEGHPLIEEARSVQISLHNQITRQKLDAFSLAWEVLPFQQRAVYDETGLLYKVADREAVEAYFARITKYLAPQQVEALQLIAGMLTGEHYREGRQISYDAIYSAMAHCYDEPLPIVQTLIRKVIAPSVYGARDHNPAYHLLLACEARLEHNRRGDLLRNVAQHENATLFIALDEALKTGAEFEAQENVSVDGQVMPMEVFLARLTNLDVRALKRSAADYLAAYQGEHETHWRIFEVMPTAEAVQYALHRLSYLLAQRDYTAIAESACLSEWQQVLKADTDHTDELLTRFVSTVEFSVNDIPGIDAVMERFANASAKTLWQNRRERVLLDCFNARLHQRGSEDIAPLRDFLERNKPFPATDWAKENLAVQLHYMPRDTWTPEHHALVNVIDDEALRQQYQTNLLKRVLLDRAFAKAHAEHLPAEEDVSGSFELITAPDFKAVCQEALTRFDQQERMDNVAGFRILHGLLMHDLAFVSDLGELQADMGRLLEKFKVQVNVQMAAQEIISLMDTQHFEEAKEKLHRQQGFLTFYQTIGDQNSYDEVVDAITLIIEAMEVRLGRDVLNTDGPPVLLRDTALSLLEEMPLAVPRVEQLQWTLQNQNNLRAMAILLRTEMNAIRDGHAATLPSLPLFNEAIERQVLGLYISERDREDLVTSLRLITEDERFATVPAQPRDTLLALLRLLKNEVQDGDAAIFSAHDVQAAAAGVSGVDTAISESSDESDVGGERFTSAELQAEVSQAIFQSFLETQDCVVAIQKLREVFSPANTNASLKADVAKDLLQFIATACSITLYDTSKAKRVSACGLLRKIRWGINQLEKQPSFPFVILASRWKRITNLLDSTVLSFKDLASHKKQDFPELNELILIILETGLVSNRIKADWTTFLEQTLLPAVGSQTSVYAPQLSAALHALYRVLKNDYSGKDRENILAYERYYRDVVNGSVHRTATMRIQAESTPVSASVPAVPVEGITHV